MPEAIPAPHPAPYQFLLALGVFFIMAMILFIMMLKTRLRERNEGQLVLAQLQELGWRDVRKFWLEAWGQKYRAMLNGRAFIIEYGNPDRGKPYLIRVSFCSPCNGNFAIRKRPPSESLPFFMRSIFPPSELDFAFPSIIAEGKDPYDLRKKLELESSDAIFQEAFRTLHDCIKFRNRKIVVDKDIRYPSYPEVSLSEAVTIRGRNRSLQESAKLAHKLVSHLLAIGF